MQVTKKLITPSIAKEMLEANVKNRNKNTHLVLKYANEMANGKWKENTGELIKISNTGVILDGQHRLSAIVKSNTPIWFHIATGLDDNIFDVLDTGMKRNAADVFKISGVKYSSSTPAIIQSYFSLKNRKVSINTSNSNSRKSSAELLEIYYSNPLFWDDIAMKTSQLYTSFAKVLTPQTIGGIYAHLIDINAHDAERFMNQMCSGDNITNKTILLLRNKLIAEKVATRKLPINIIVALIIKSWNHFRKGNQISNLRFQPEIEDMPIAI